MRGITIQNLDSTQPRPQADVPEPIDFNSELATVGLSNIVCGLTGSGYTGARGRRLKCPMPLCA